MADGYLEDRYNEWDQRKHTKTVIKKVSLNDLLKRNRSYRGFRPDVAVNRDVLEKIVSVNPLLPSARNQQVLRFKLITEESECATVLANVTMGAALPELHLPYPGSEPRAFIIICSTIAENKMVDIDLGISAQSMLLKANELGLNGLIIGAFRKEPIREALQLPYEPLLILALGKGNEQIACVEIGESESHTYYRRDGIHYVPKVRIEDLILP